MERPGSAEADELEGWDQLVQLTGGLDPDQADALKEIRGLEPIYPLAPRAGRTLGARLLVRAAALEALVGANQSTFTTEELSEVLHWLSLG